ncbi:hypothetical protein D3C77_484300 [compost metagenome]
MAGKGISVSDKTVTFDFKPGGGLALSDNQAIVDTAVTNPVAGKGIHVSGKTVTFDFKLGGGLALSGDQAIVDTTVTNPVAGPGINVSGRNVSVQPGKGINTENGVSIDPNAWIWILGSLHKASHYFDFGRVRGFFSKHDQFIIGRLYAIDNIIFRPHNAAYDLSGRKAVAVHLEQNMVVIPGNLFGGLTFSVECDVHGNNNFVTFRGDVRSL